MRWADIVSGPVRCCSATGTAWRVRPPNVRHGQGVGRAGSTTLLTVVEPEPHGDVPEGPNPFAVLADAARAIHGERDAARLLAWVCDAACRVTGAAAAGVWLAAHRPGWVTAGMA